MLNKISTLPNYCNGKLYKRWDRVMNIFGQDSILATKKSPKGENIMLMITENGKKRELYSDSYKITEIIDSSGIKRTYTYNKGSNNVVYGQMTSSVPESAVAPLISSAKWTNDNNIPQRLELVINTENPSSVMNVLQAEDNMYVRKPQKVSKMIASEFLGHSEPVPRKIDLILENGQVISVNDPSVGNVFKSPVSDEPLEAHPMKHLQVLV